MIQNTRPDDQTSKRSAQGVNVPHVAEIKVVIVNAGDGHVTLAGSVDGRSTAQFLHKRVEAS